MKRAKGGRPHSHPLGCGTYEVLAFYVSLGYRLPAVVRLYEGRLYRPLMTQGIRPYALCHAMTSLGLQAILGLLDASGAFDSLSWRLINEALKKYGATPKCRAIFRAIYVAVCGVVRTTVPNPGIHAPSIFTTAHAHPPLTNARGRIQIGGTDRP